MENYILKLLKIKDSVRTAAPLVHCITNPISINDCANAVLALGAKPIMAEHPLETADIAASAEALCVNLGNITDVRLEGITAAAQSANKNNVPIIIDAVGVTCSSLRKRFCLDFINKFKPDIIKGNAAEIKALAGESFAAKGINRYNANTYDIHKDCMDRKKIVTNSLFLYPDRIVVRTYDHHNACWLTELDREFPLYGTES